MLERRVVFATDLLGSVDRGLALATRFAHEHAATLTILHVVPIRAVDGVGMLHASVDLVWDDVGARLRSLTPEDPRVPFTHVLTIGDPVEKIREYVEREPVDLLVMEARRRTLFDRLWGPDLPTVLRSTTRCVMLTYRDDSELSHEQTELSRFVETTPFEALTVMLDARVEALSRWMTSQREAVVAISERASIRDGVASVLRGSGALVQRTEQLLALELHEHCKASGVRGFEVLVGGEPLLDRGWRAAPGPGRDACVARALREGAAVSLPLEPKEASPTTHHVIMAAAAVAIPGADPVVLVTTHDAREHFLRILAQPGPSPTAETYAFDADGVMISNSLFPEQLRRVGLLPAEPGLQTPGRIRVCDPGGNLLTGEIQVPGAMPLTRMAVSATAGESGSDWHGYRDYRGVEVVGTWRWVEEHGFGVAAEMDRPDAPGRSSDAVS